MTSAIAFLANATAVFTVPTSGTITEAATGNVVPATESVTVTLYLRGTGGSAPRLSDFPGVGVEDDTLEGYAVSPQALDDRITPGTRGTLTYSGEASCACEVAAARYPFGGTGFPGETLQGILGDKIRLNRYRQR
jgi:hypothetical protein